MAHIYRADLHPSKIEIITEWLRAQPWFEGNPTHEVEKLGSFRFDDPEGRVGIETLLVTAGGPALQVPLTYRDTPLADGEGWFLGTTEHSVLGTRYVYDAIGDPAYLRALAVTAFGGGIQATEYWEDDGVRTFREPLTVVHGSGAAGTTPLDAPIRDTITTSDDNSGTIATAGNLRVALARVPGASSSADALAALTGGSAVKGFVTGTWPGNNVPAVLALVARD